MEEEPKVFLPAESYRKKKARQNLIFVYIGISFFIFVLGFILYLVLVEGLVNTTDSPIKIGLGLITLAFKLVYICYLGKYIMSDLVYQYEIYESSTLLEIYYVSKGRTPDYWIAFEFKKGDVELRIDFWGRLMFYNFRSKKYLPLRRTLAVPDAFLASLNLTDKELIIIREWFRGGKSAIKRFSLPRSYSVTKSW